MTFQIRFNKDWWPDRNWDNNQVKNHFRNWFERYAIGEDSCLITKCDKLHFYHGKVTKCKPTKLGTLTKMSDTHADVQETCSNNNKRDAVVEFMIDQLSKCKKPKSYIEVRCQKHSFGFRKT